MKLNNIHIIPLGFQTLPTEWFNRIKSLFPKLEDKVAVTNPLVRQSIINKLGVSYQIM